VVIQNLQLGSVARIGEGKDDIAFDDHAKIAVRGLSRMEIDGRRTGRGKRGGNFPADVARFANAGDNNTSLGRTQHFASCNKSITQRFRKAIQSARFRVDNFSRSRKNAIGGFDGLKNN
jgi:hypothetical protein